jgi:hypothetical protein
MRTLGWLACHIGEGGRLEWWAIPAWMPAAGLLTVRRLTAWAVLSASGGLAIAATVWAAIPFGIVGWTAVAPGRAPRCSTTRKSVRILMHHSSESAPRKAKR